MQFTIEGGIKRMLERNAGKTKAGNDFVSQEFVVVVPNGNYMDDVCFRAFGDACGKIAGLKAGDDVRVTFTVRSREWNGRWFTDLNVIDVQALGGDMPGDIADDDIDL
jgi:hypothetical protein